MISYQKEKQDISKEMNNLGIDILSINFNKHEINMSGYQNNTVQSSCVKLGSTPFSIKVHEVFRNMNLKSITMPTKNEYRYLYKDGSEETHLIKDLFIELSVPEIS